MLRTRPRERHDGPTGLVCTVSTVKDTVDNLRTFVDRNLSAGADHMFVFLDDADAEAHAKLAELEHVTAVRAGKRYWRGQRPSNLNVRQVVNANLVNVLLASFEEVGWLFHLDGDECLDLDKAQLNALTSDVRAVQLRTLEAVSQAHWTGPVEVFKRPLPDDDLHLLHVLGVLDAPSMRHYFNGHDRGKPGMRPDVDRRLRIHHVEELDEVPVEARAADWLNVLHYDSWSGEEFVRKWEAHLSSGRETQFSKRKNGMRAAIASVLDNPVLDDARRRILLMQIYRRLIEDDVETLEGLGFLVRPPAERHRYRPAGFAAADEPPFQALFERLRAADKAYFTWGPDARPARELLHAVHGELGRTDPDLAHRIGRALGR